MSDNNTPKHLKNILDYAGIRNSRVVLEQVTNLLEKNYRSLHTIKKFLIQIAKILIYVKNIII